MQGFPFEPYSVHVSFAKAKTVRHREDLMAFIFLLRAKSFLGKIAVIQRSRLMTCGKSRTH